MTEYTFIYMQVDVNDFYKWGKNQYNIKSITQIVKNSPMYVKPNN